MKAITGKDIFKQLKYDLIGKDSYRGVTLTYSWLANQFGHIGLGFIPTLIVYVILTHCFGATNASTKAAIGVWATWILFEVYNCVEPILFNHSKKYTFAPPWGNIIYDTATDLSFFGIGALASGCLCTYSPGLLTGLIILFVLVACPARDWYLTKMYEQEAGYPFQFRLSQWGASLSEENTQKVLAFADVVVTGKHLFLFGAYKSGKTSLSVAIANERSIKHHTCTYVTAMKLFSLFFEPIDPIEDLGSLWSWRNASLLVIDDINPGFPLKEEVVTPNAFLRFLDHDGMGEANKKVIREKNIIWVLGTDDAPDNTRQQKWEEMLVHLGINRNNITSINLS
jgi:hypothetical protein